jgi:hypothetical protein
MIKSSQRLKDRLLHSGFVNHELVWSSDPFESAKYIHAFGPNAAMDLKVHCPGR